MPLVIILERSNDLKNLDLLDHILALQEESDNSKKNGIFY